MAVRLARTLSLAAAAAASTVLLAAPVAFAHVTVHPDTVQPGSTDGTFTFRVPNEEDKSNTVQVEVAFPAEAPIASVLVAPVPGWTAKVTTRHLVTPLHTDDGDITDVVSDVTWSGGAITPGQYQDFTIAYGKLPDGPGPIDFKALQTYSDGTVVRWIDLTQPGQPEPDHPAPVVEMTATAAPAPTSRVAAAPPANNAGSDSSESTAALAVASAALLAGGLALWRGRSVGTRQS